MEQAKEAATETETKACDTSVCNAGRVIELELSRLSCRLSIGWVCDTTCKHHSLWLNLLESRQRLGRGKGRLSWFDQGKTGVNSHLWLPTDTRG
jgi:hypothetical protein